jgi:hypothetical protein
MVMAVLLGAALCVQGQTDKAGSSKKGKTDSSRMAARAAKAEDEVHRSDFRVSVGAHYKASAATIDMARKKKIKDDELPVLFHLSARAKAKPEVVMDLRAKGMSWAQITLHLGLGADIYHVPLKADPGPPYGNAYGHFKKRKRSEWRGIVLADADIVNLVNLRFMADYHGFSPDEAVKIRARHRDCFSFHANLKKMKMERRKAAERKKASGKSGSGKSGKDSGEERGKHGDRSKDAERKKHDDHDKQKGSKGKSGKGKRGKG